VSCSDQLRFRAVAHPETPGRHAYGYRRTTRDGAVVTAGIAGLRIGAEAGKGLVEHPPKWVAKRGRLAHGHKARVSCGYLPSHWRSTLAPSDNPAVRRRQAGECVAFFRGIVQICEDPERSDERVSEEIRQAARGFAEWAEEYITQENPNHPLMPLIYPMKDTFFVGPDSVGDIPLTFKKARECSLLIANVLETMIGGPAVFDSQHGGGGQPGEERRRRATAWIDRY
jgi:hypothetical protein